jgi:transcriptional regulator with XRE-family HTH domain
MDDSLIIGNLIREIRKSKSISQEQLSERSGLDRSFISMLERGKKNPTLSTLIKLCKALDVSLTELISEFEVRQNKEVEDEKRTART